MKAVRLKIFCAGLSAALMLASSPAWPQSNQIVLDPLCMADFCPGCPQPLDMGLADNDCRACVNRNLIKVSFCAKSQKKVLDKDLVGLWRAKSGLTMAVKQNSQGFWGQLTYVPEKLSGYYPLLGVEIIRAQPVAQSKYKGSLLAPSGKWVDAEFAVSGQEMVSNHPGGKSVQWRKTIAVHLPNPAAMEFDDSRRLERFRNNTNE